LTGVGGRLAGKNASRFSGTKATQKAASARNFSDGKASQRSAFASDGRTSAKVGAGRQGSTVSGNKSIRAKETAMRGEVKAKMAKAEQRKASKAGMKPGSQLEKAAPNAAKAKYKMLSGRSRQSSVYASASQNKKAAGAKRSLNNFVAKRGVAKGKK
jgi:hypothetical protein